MKVCLGQVHPIIVDFRHNFNIIMESINVAVQNECDVLLLPELVTTGYPPRDHLYNKEVWHQNDIIIDRVFDQIQLLSRSQRNLTVIMGGLHRVPKSYGMFSNYNAAWILDKTFGKRWVHKRLLPCYDVFDETRYFDSGQNEPYLPVPISVGSEKVHCDVLICEDIWNHNFCNDLNQSRWLSPFSYGVDPTQQLSVHNSGPVFVINGSPFWHNKVESTVDLLHSISKKLNRPVFWCNQVGAHDDIITGGYSMLSYPSCIKIGKMFQTDYIIADLNNHETSSLSYVEFNNFDQCIIDDIRIPVGGPQPVLKGEERKIALAYNAIKLYLADYCRNTGFKRAVFGCSGGIDSAVVAVIASHVLGSSNVTAITMPSPYSSEGSVNDSEILCKNLGINLLNLSISDLYHKTKEICLSGVKPKFNNAVTDENIQPRLRAILLMAFSNDNDAILLCTGNKSEMSVGYTTLYGDSTGGISLLSDLYKTEIYVLAEFLNKHFNNVIPKSIIDKAPSAELKPGQKDIDSLPPYPVLDKILQLLIDQEMSLSDVKQSVKDIAISGIVDKVYRLYVQSEFKRQQSPLSPKLSLRSWGSGRRMPISANFRTI